MRPPLGGRPAPDLLLAPFRRRHYRALGGSLRRLESPALDLWRYLTFRGAYPYRCRIRTPLGQVAPTLWSPHDMLTVVEVFAKQIYPVMRDASTIVDLGANIGISALYFLTEAPRSRLHLFEPNPRLTPRLRANLAGFEDRVEIEAAAVADFEAAVEFGLEPTGRYGGIGIAGTDTIELRARSASAVLEEVLEIDGRIDLLKIDIEAGETSLLRSLSPELLSSIGTIHVETELPGNPLPGAMVATREGLVTTLVPARKA